MDLSAGDLAAVDDDGIWKANAPALDAFLAVATQWRDSGLDYAGVRAGFQLAALDVDAALWADIQVIEIGARFGPARSCVPFPQMRHGWMTRGPLDDAARRCGECGALHV